MSHEGARPDAADPNAPEHVAAEVARLIGKGRTLWERRMLADFERPLHQALALAERAFGPDDVQTAWALAHVAWLASARGQHVDAVRDYRRALEIREGRQGPHHPDTLRAAEELAAALFQAEARDPEADSLALRAIAGHEAAGCDDAELATLIACVGWRRYWIGRYIEAEPLLLRGLAIQERILGLGDPATAETAKRLAIMYDHRGFEADPEPFYRKALDGFELVHETRHPAVLEAQYRLADFLRRHGRQEDSDPLFEHLVVALQDENLDGDSGHLHWIISGCCSYLRNLGREADAEALETVARRHDPVVAMVRAEVDQAEAAHGSESPEAAEALGHLADFLALAGRADEAEAAARRCVEVYEMTVGRDNPSTAQAAQRLSAIREQAEAWKANPRTSRLQNYDGSRFDPFTQPWNDEVRPDLIRAYLASLSAGDDDPEGAQAAITAMTFMADLETQWDVILSLIAQAEESDEVLQHLAAGPLEGFLSQFDDAVIDRVEAEAARDPRFRRVLSGVWELEMSDAVWDRVRSASSRNQESTRMIVVLMGVTGSGKTTVGKVLARELGWTFVDADDFHPAANVEKMRRGIPLTDEGRRPWLRALARRIDEARDRGENIVLACSALKHAYQEYLRHHLDAIRYVCLCGPEDLIKTRLAARTGHFMNPALLQSQFEILDPPDDAIRVDVSGSSEEIAGEIRSRLRL